MITISPQFIEKNIKQTHRTPEKDQRTDTL